MHKHKGFNIVEVMITLVIGLVIFSGVLSVFVGMRTTSDETSRYGILQETGRFAISLLSDDLMRQGYFGQLMTSPSTSNLRTIPMPPTLECTGEGLNNGTFPTANGHFRTLWSTTTSDANNLGCINDATRNTQESDILQIKRTLTNSVTNAQRNAQSFYLVSNYTEAHIVTGQTAIPAPAISDAQIHEYQHHIYYVADQKQGSVTIPTLKAISLSPAKMVNQPLLDGVEKIRFMFGVDTDLDGAVNAFVSANDMNDSGSGTGRLWDDGSVEILAVKIYVLVRDLKPDNDYTNNVVYHMGNDTDGKYTAPGDNFRRMLFSSTISLYNKGVKVWD
ncbi:prepilin-type N-terminal cleavage/methylation domain-containing protein [Thalassotalea euphylliae]|uniref:Prepilin-type N-terminal cleavage/methylation domain-containing protein n=1 Tax=Thalassotalea euphylliae TaxID=1655234 RepID=A0A3E0TN84_9GAMM|nr:PilW family protein [Thalassotalea euphylliae]REL26004.1 prepilin-type N-terminal cleavage/methylation domain-containing protein [Thalassotalea euphylliae]